MAARRGRGRRPSDTSASAAATTGPTSGGLPKRGRVKRLADDIFRNVYLSKAFVSL